MTGQPVGEAADLDVRWQDWSARRPQFRGTHLDCGAAGRQSTAVLRVVADHALREAQHGAYVAEAEAAPLLATGRARVAGLFGVPTDGVAFVSSAGGALLALLSAWPLADGGTVAVTASEWGPNLQTFESHGLQVRMLDTDADGLLDLDALERTLSHDPPALVHLTHVASHRGLVQPVAATAVQCRAAGVPLWVDAAQGLGHVDIATGADAVYATSRKWLCGPRGVGVLGVAERWWDRLRLAPYVLDPHRPVVARWESSDAHVAGRLGLCAAVEELLDDGPEHVWRRLDEVGRQTRAALADLPGWQVLAAPEGSGAITAVRATAGQDVAAVRARLLAEHGLLTTVSTPARAPREMREPLLRISPHVDCTAATLAALRHALTEPS